MSLLRGSARIRKEDSNQSSVPWGQMGSMGKGTAEGGGQGLLQKEGFANGAPCSLQGLPPFLGLAPLQP